MSRPRRLKNPRQISIRLESSLVVALQHRAEELGIDRSQLINQLLKRNIEKNPFTQEEPEFHELAADPPAKYRAKPAQDAAS